MSGAVTSVPNVEHDKLKAELAMFIRNIPVIIEFEKYTAKVRRAKYEFYLGEGFSPEQALELCK